MHTVRFCDPACDLHAVIAVIVRERGIVAPVHFRSGNRFAVCVRYRPRKRTKVGFQDDVFLNCAVRYGEAGFRKIRNPSAYTVRLFVPAGTCML